MRILVPVMLLAAAGLAVAHHRQSNAILPLAVTGDVALPRLPAPGKKTIALIRPADGAVIGLSPFRDRDVERLVFPAGNNARPSVSSRGVVFAWDTDADPLNSDAPGRQVIVSTGGVLTQAAVDPTGTSTNPALDARGLYVAFESTGDLAGAGNAGARQVFLRRPDGSLIQVSRGTGTSRNPTVNSKGAVIAFASTSHPGTGADTGVSQIWTAPLAGSPAAPITSGAGPSDDPVLSADGRVLVFTSTAALATDGHDTSVRQVFAYHPQTQTFAQITDDTSGCERPSIGIVKRDWRITFVCNGEAFYYMLRADQRLRVQTDGGHTSHIAPQFGVHFVVVSTTADLVNGGVTTDHQLYIVNLFKRPAEAATGLATWFPSRGVPPL